MGSRDLSKQPLASGRYRRERDFDAFVVEREGAEGRTRGPSAGPPTALPPAHRESTR